MSLRSFLRRARSSLAPPGVSPVQKRNFINVQIDAIGIGLANAASPFLPVFLTRLGATNNQIGLLTSLPGITGLILALPVGRFLQRQRNIVPWFSGSRLLVISAYALTGLAAFFVPQQYQVTAILAIWALATLPQTALAVCFSVVMNAVAGPQHRYDLMSRRWSILGVTTALTAAVAGQVLVKLDFPINYELVFIALSVGGLISYVFSRRIVLPDAEPPEAVVAKKSIREATRSYAGLILRQPEFTRFSVKRYIFIFGTLIATPIFPLYYVREVNANDAWIGLISTAQTAVLVFGYFFWTRAYRARGSRFVLLWTTLGLALYPALVAATQQVQIIVVLAGIAGIFQAGTDLVFFDELMKTVPVEYSATFVSFSQGLQYSAAIVAPLIGTWLSASIGLGGVLMVSAGVRLIGFVLFALWNPKPVAAVQPAS
jgi:MFS family permease